MKKSFLCLLCVLLPISLMGATIFSDNFDSCSGNCNSAAAGAYWDQWTSSGGSSATHDSVTHYSGEISSPGRGGSGMSYKIWRYGTDWGDSNEFTGGLVKYIGGTYNDIWIRYYIKIPTAMTLNGCDYCKLWMLNPAGGESIYVDFANVERGSATLILDDYNDGNPSVTLLDATETLAIWDGNWHCLQFHLDNTSSTGTARWRYSLGTFGTPPSTFTGGLLDGDYNEYNFEAYVTY